MAGAPSAPLASSRPAPGHVSLSEILVDTDVISYLLNRHSLAAGYEGLLLGYTPLISFVTVAEMYRGALKRGWGERRMADLDLHLRQFAVVPYSAKICISYAELSIAAEKKGHPIAFADAFIAASALSLEIPLLTHNRRHFQGIKKLSVISAQ
jgi:tRNA(fMet)-specific endonuclease VapC